MDDNDNEEKNFSVGTKRAVASTRADHRCLTVHSSHPLAIARARLPLRRHLVFFVVPLLRGWTRISRIRSLTRISLLKWKMMRRKKLAPPNFLDEHRSNLYHPIERRSSVSRRIRRFLSTVVARRYTGCLDLRSEIDSVRAVHPEQILVRDLHPVLVPVSNLEIEPVCHRRVLPTVASTPFAKDEGLWLV